VAVSAGWMAGMCGRAGGLIADNGFMERVRELLQEVPAVHADETPDRTAGGTRYMHLACTQYLTHMHTGDRSAPGIDAGQVLPATPGRRPRRLLRLRSPHSEWLAARPGPHAVGNALTTLADRAEAAHFAGKPNRRRRTRIVDDYSCLSVSARSGLMMDAR
jgi:hypothetical protein